LAGSVSARVYWKQPAAPDGKTPFSAILSEVSRLRTWGLGGSYGLRVSIGRGFLLAK